MSGLVSICICTYRRALLQQTLESLARLEIPDGVKIEVVVVDNDASAFAQPIVERFAAGVPFRVRYTVEPRKGLSFARNCALNAAAGDWLALIDDDEVAAPSWLARLLESAERYQADAAIGAVLPQFEQTPPAWLVNSRFFDRWLPPTGTRIGMGIALTGNALFRAGFLRISGLHFDHDFNATGGEDSDFFRRFTDQGGVVVSAREAVVREFVPRERMTAQHLTKGSLWIGEIYARLSHRHGGPLAWALNMLRAGFNLGAAALLTLINLPRGRASYYRYYLLLLRNAGKFRYYFGFRPIEMYK